MNPSFLSLSYTDHPIRSLILEGQPWFAAVDICSILELVNNRQAIRVLHPDDRKLVIQNGPNVQLSDIENPDLVQGLDDPAPSEDSTVDIADGRTPDLMQGSPNTPPFKIPNRGIVFINEPGLYSLIFRSRKPEAEAFQRWVTKDVLPEIRRTGAYNASKSPEARFLYLFDALTDRKFWPHDASKLALKFIRRTTGDDFKDGLALKLADEISTRIGDKVYGRELAKAFKKELERVDYFHGNTPRIKDS